VASSYGTEYDPIPYFNSVALNWCAAEGSESKGTQGIVDARVEWFASEKGVRHVKENKDKFLAYIENIDPEMISKLIFKSLRKACPQKTQNFIDNAKQNPSNA